jgi:BASS family bile acid:Na+ symporter
MAKLINLLAFITLFEMMITIGLRVTIAEVSAVARNVRLVALALIANYALVPAVTLGLLLWMHPHPLVSAGFLIVAVCPGAPYAPPFTAIAKGNTAVAVGLMFILAASSALLAPLLLRILLPIVMGSEGISISLGSLIGTLMAGQFIPLCIGLGISHRNPALAKRIERPASKISTALNLLLVVILLATNFSTLAQIRITGYLVMLLLLGVSMLCGWAISGGSFGDRNTLAIVTGVRNVGVALLITINALANTPAVSAATSYALVQTLGAALIAIALGRIRFPGTAHAIAGRADVPLTTEGPA